MFVAWIPVLNGGVFHLRIVLNDNLYDGSMQLIFIAHGRCASLKITHISVVFGHNEGSFKLSCVACINSKVRTKLHWAAHSLGNIDKRAI